MLSGMKVVIVDDEPEVRSMLRFELEMLGATVVEAANGREGLTEIRNHRPALILSDVRMPTMDGIQMLEELRLTCTTPLILLSGFADIPVWETYARGAEAYVAKPFRPEVLIETIERVMTPLPNRRGALMKATNSLDLSFEFRSWDEASKALALGRGGLFVTWAPTGVRRDKPVTIRVTIGGANGARIAAEGIVRWVRPSAEPGLPAGSGVEILSLSGADTGGFPPPGGHFDQCAFIPRAVRTVS